MRGRSGHTKWADFELGVSHRRLTLPTFANRAPDEDHGEDKRAQGQGVGEHL